MELTFESTSPELENKNHIQLGFTDCQPMGRCLLLQTPVVCNHWDEPVWSRVSRMGLLWVTVWDEYHLMRWVSSWDDVWQSPDLKTPWIFKGNPQDLSGLLRSVKATLLLLIIIISFSDKKNFAHCCFWLEESQVLFLYCHQVVVHHDIGAAVYGLGLWGFCCLCIMT